MLPRSLYYFIFVLLIAACQHEPASNSSSEAKQQDGFSRKHEPIDANLDLRLGVRSDFSLKTYKAAIKEANQSLTARSAPPGFDNTWEVEGPFTEGGRINVLTIDPRNQDIVYIGFSRGGLWKTTNNGDDWLPISDQLPFPTIGAITLDVTTDRIWIGTGDSTLAMEFIIVMTMAHPG